MTAVAYATLLDDIQTQVFNILSNDTTQTITFHNNTTGTLKSNVKVLDGIPQPLAKGEGFPYLLVRTPYTSKKRITSTKFRITTTVPIWIFDTKEKNVRRILDAADNALKTNQATTRAVHLWEYLSSSSDVSVSPIPESGNTLYQGNLNIEYKSVKS